MSKKVQKAFADYDELFINDGKLTVIAREVEAELYQGEYDESIGDFLAEVDPAHYETVTYDWSGPIHTERYDTLDELVTGMRRMAPLTHWRYASVHTEI